MRIAIRPHVQEIKTILYTKRFKVFNCILITDSQKLIDRRDACPTNRPIGKSVNWQIGKLVNW